jgi:hypothetical protein
LDRHGDHLRLVFSFHVSGDDHTRLPLKIALGVPAAYIYNWLFALWFIPIVVSYSVFSFEERREAQKEEEVK